MRSPRMLPAALVLLMLGAVAPARNRPVHGAVLSNDQWPRAANLREWTSDVLRISGTQRASETAQGKAFFEWLRLFVRMAVGGMIQASEGGYGRERTVLDAHKQLFVYGWGYCDTASRIAEAAWQEYKRDRTAAVRVITQHAGGEYHTMYRLRMDGRYGGFDPRYGYYLVAEDAPEARVLDWSEIHGKFHVNESYRCRSKPFFEIGRGEWARALLIQPGYFETEADWRAAGAPVETVFGDGAHKMGAEFHAMGFTLKRGMTITRYWDNSARKFYVPASPRATRELPFLPSGRFYRVTDASHGGNWPRNDPNYQRAKPYLVVVPSGEGYPAELVGGRTIGQAYGIIDYRPPLARAEDLDAIEDGAALASSLSAPYLRPRRASDGGDAVLDLRSPFVLVDGTVTARLAGDAEISIRTLAPKAIHAREPDQWSEWQLLFKGPGRHEAALGRPRFNGRDVSIHGIYRFQLRVRVPPHVARKRPAGLSALRVRLYFENGIMSIPPLFPGRNTIRFRLQDAAALTGPVWISYRYAAPDGTRTHRQELRPASFTGNEAAYAVVTPGLTRCHSVSISY
ncbi:MAG: hypothetical protein ACOYX1_13145 [Acidobacteriota bacterium]